MSVLIVQRQVHEIWAGLTFENGVTNLGARVEGAREHDEDHRYGLIDHELRSDRPRHPAEARDRDELWHGGVRPDKAVEDVCSNSCTHVTRTMWYSAPPRYVKALHRMSLFMHADAAPVT